MSFWTLHFHYEINLSTRESNMHCSNLKYHRKCAVREYSEKKIRFENKKCKFFTFMSRMTPIRKNRCQRCSQWRLLRNHKNWFHLCQENWFSNQSNTWTFWTVFDSSYSDTNNNQWIRCDFLITISSFFFASYCSTKTNYARWQLCLKTQYRRIWSIWQLNAVIGLHC